MTMRLMKTTCSMNTSINPETTQVFYQREAQSQPGRLPAILIYELTNPTNLLRRISARESQTDQSLLEHAESLAREEGFDLWHSQGRADEDAIPQETCVFATIAKNEDESIPRAMIFFRVMQKSSEPEDYLLEQSAGLDDDPLVIVRSLLRLRILWQEKAAGNHLRFYVADTFIDAVLDAATEKQAEFAALESERL